MGQKKKKMKKSTLTVRTLTTSTGTLITVPLTEEKEALQLNKTLHRSTVEKRGQRDLNCNRENYS